jgi:hypothetical protein
MFIPKTPAENTVLRSYLSDEKSVMPVLATKGGILCNKIKS